MTNRDTASGRPPRLRVASVSYLNATPLNYGLDAVPDIDLSLDVPARLVAGLQEGQTDVALLPVIDYPRVEGARVLTAGCIGCDGPTLTVRIFSKRPIDEIDVLHCDADSHTSVALARVILAERYGRTPRLLPLDRAEAEDGAKLLIGDKVVCEEPKGYPHQLDLGEAWKQVTGLPFVFAIWTARAGINLGVLASQLEAAKRTGLSRVDELIARFGVPRGWPKDLARQYLTQYLKFDVGEKQLQAIRLFHQLATKHGMLAQPGELVVHDSAAKRG